MESRAKGLESQKIIHVSTSGSTGHAKPLLRDAASWQVSAEREAQAFGFCRAERFCVFASATHSLWVYAHFRAQLTHAPVIGVEPLQARHTSRGLLQLCDFKPTVVYTIPDLVPLLLQAKAEALRGVKHLIVGGGAWLKGHSAHLSAATLHPQMRVHLFYGSAECSFIGWTRPENLPWYRPFTDVQLQLMDGELYVRSPMTISPEDWIATGDLVELSSNADEFRILGRKARAIRVFGKHLQPEPIEEFLQARGYCERCVLTLEEADRPRLVLLYRQGSRQLNAGEIRQAVTESFPQAPAIHRFVELANWPLLPSGKTDFEAFRHNLCGDQHLGTN